MRAALVCLASLALAACADQTGVLVQISSTDLGVPADVDGLTIRAHTPDALMLDQSFAIRTSWPQSLLVRPASGEALGDLLVEVIGTHGGAFVVQRVVMTTFAPGQVRHVDVQLSRDCAHVVCGEGNDCVAGVCHGVTTNDAGPGDGGVDAAIADAHTRDVGLDMGTDAGTDAGTNCSGHSCVVVSEVAPHGVTAFDEFVELYNRGPARVDVSGCSLVYYTAAGMPSPRAMFSAGTTIASHGFYLLGSASYVGTVTPDMPMAWSTGLADADATVSFECGAAPIDQLGYGPGATVREGSSAPAIPTASVATSSYERKAHADSTATTMASGGRDATSGNGQDTDDNSADFVIRATREPQSSSSPTEP